MVAHQRAGSQLAWLIVLCDQRGMTYKILPLVISQVIRIMAKKKPHTVEQIKSFQEELAKQTDGGVAVLAAAVLEDLLELVIQKRLIELSSDRREALFGRMAPLSTFSAKIELGFAIGLYDERLRKPLDMIRDVRNKFAHRMEALSFDDPKIMELVQRARPQSAPTKLSTREVFLMCFNAASMLLYVEHAGEIRLKPLGETHQQLFVEFALLLNDLQRGMVSVSGHIPRGQVRPSQPKPE
jgi:DNA-binding MltR family transcriptional regulator